MSATAAVAAQPATISTKPRQLTWEEFQKKYLSREDRYKYEWVNGQVVKTLRSMDQTQAFLQLNFTNLLHKLEAKSGKPIGLFSVETDSFFNGNHRRPDISFFSVKEIERMRTGEKIVPRFVIEVISKNDGINEVNDKLDEYFNAGVRLAWLVFPKSKMIQIYHPNGSNERLRGSSVCSAESVIPGFVFAVEEILK